MYIAVEVRHLESFLYTLPNAERMLLNAWLYMRTQDGTYFYLKEIDLEALHENWQCNLSAVFMQRIHSIPTIVQTEVRASDVIRLRSQRAGKQKQTWLKKWSRTSLTIQ